MKVTYYRFPKDMPLADAFRAWKERILRRVQPDS